jgi:ABC-type amino acid transport substrate-binding protein
MKDREKLVSQLDILAKSLIKVSAYVVKFAPIGVFAIAASVSGTISLAEFTRLKAYFAAYTVGAGMLAFVILPLLVTCCTPFSYRDVISLSKEALLTAFATGKLIVVLPMLIAKTEELFARYLPEKLDEETADIDVLYPLAYPFPHLGRLLALLFIPFAAWFSGNAMTVAEYPGFLLSGLFAYFGGPLLATPFLLDQMRLPHDMFQLFLASGVYCERLSDAVGAMHLVAFTTITTCLLTGAFQLRYWRLAKTMILSGGVLLGLVALLRISLSSSLETQQNREELIANLQLIEQPVESVVIRDATPNPDPLLPGETLLERIRRRGIIRVGYNEDKLPFAYFNIRGELVGFDVNMAHAFARDLGVTIEFVRFDRATLAEQLAGDNFDIVMSGLVGTLERSERMEHTAPYMDVTLSLVVQDFRVRGFSSYDSMRQIDGLRIGFVDLSRGFVNRLKATLPNAELVELNTNREFFREAYRDLDALLISAESGSAFTLFYPRFEVVVPEGERVSLPLFYAIGQRDDEMRAFLEHWVALRKKDGTMQEAYDHWILGKSKALARPRWSVIRDVLGWVK